MTSERSELSGYFLIYINDLSKNLPSITKLFADDTSIFSVVHDVDLSAEQFNDDLNRFLNGHFSGKWFSILICLSKCKKLSFLVKLLK